MNITASVKGVIQRGIAQVEVKGGRLHVTLTDGTQLNLGTVAGRGITLAQVKGDDLILHFSDGTTQNVGSIRGRGISHAYMEGDHLMLAYTDGVTQNVGSFKNRGIQSIAKTGTQGKTDTYTITYTDGTSWTYTVENGRDGTFDGTLQGDLRLRGGCVRFQSRNGADLFPLAATTDPDSTIRLGGQSQPIRVGPLANPLKNTDAVNKAYVDSLLAGSVNAIDRLIGGN